MKFTFNSFIYNNYSDYVIALVLLKSSYLTDYIGYNFFILKSDLVV